MTIALSLNQKLAIGAVALGAVALAAEPRAGHTVSIAPKDLAVIVQREVDHVTPRDLADWIIAGRADYRLIDLRPATEYGAYHIPGAEQMDVAALPDQRFEPTEKVVLYSDGGTHAAQAWFLLRARGAHNAYILLGGLEGWRDEVLFPQVGASDTPFQRQRNEAVARVAAHFGGRPVAAGADAGAPALTTAAAGPGGAVPAPAIVVPSMPAGAASPAAAAPRKKKEGC